MGVGYVKSQSYPVIRITFPFVYNDKNVMNRTSDIRNMLFSKFVEGNGIHLNLILDLFMEFLLLLKKTLRQAPNGRIDGCFLQGNCR